MDQRAARARVTQERELLPFHAEFPREDGGGGKGLPLEDLPPKGEGTAEREPGVLQAPSLSAIVKRHALGRSCTRRGSSHLPILKQNSRVPIWSSAA